MGGFSCIKTDLKENLSTGNQNLHKMFSFHRNVQQHDHESMYEEV